MNTNAYLEKYIRSRVEENETRTLKESLVWRDKIHGITIQPDHFNYFYFKVFVDGGESTLAIKKARELGKWLLEVTDGVESEHLIMEEIVKRTCK